MTEDNKMPTWEKDAGRIFGDIINLLYLDDRTRKKFFLFIDGLSTARRKDWLHTLDQLIDRALEAQCILIEKTIEDLRKGR